MFHDLRPLEVNNEFIDKEAHTYLSSATGNAPIAVTCTSEKEEPLMYPFASSPGSLVDFSPFNQFIASYGIELADENTPENCCVSVAVRDMS